MIFNLSAYINNELSSSEEDSTYDAIVNGEDPSITEEGLYLNDNGGEVITRLGTRELRVQAKYKSTARYTAKKYLTNVYDLLVGENGAGRWGVTLPEVTIGDDIYSEVYVAQLLSIQTPSYIGADVNGLHQFSVNFKITLGG